MSQMNTDPIRAAALKEIRGVLALQDKQPGASGTVHQLRVCTKKLRAFLRAYPDTTTIQETNHQLKVLSDSYSDARDADVLEETLQQLISGWSLKKQAKHRVMLDAIKQQEWGSFDSGTRIDPYVAFEQVLTSWPDLGNDKRFCAAGLNRVYEKAQRLGEAALKASDDESYHRWRKWVKYWLYGLTDIAQGNVSSSYIKKLKRLGDALGYFHDVCEFESMLFQSRYQERFGQDLKPLFKTISIEKKALKKSFKKAYKVLFRISSRKRQKMIGRVK